MVEQGSHAELMERQAGHYREYLMLQGATDDQDYQGETDSDQRSIVRLSPCQFLT